MLSQEEEENLYQLLESLQEEHINIALQIAAANSYTIDSGPYDKLIRFLGDSYLPILKKGDLIEKLKTIGNFSSINRYFTKKIVLDLPKKISLFKKLSHLSLVGTIEKLTLPESFADLRALKSLRINGSSMQEIPDLLFELEQLEYLNLAANLLEEIPEGISKLHNLQTLILSNNICLSKLPESLFELPKLRFLYLDNCLIDYLPPSFSESNISYLRINGYKYQAGEDDFYYTLMDDTLFKKAYDKKRYTLLNNVPLKIIKHGAFHIKKFLKKDL